MRATWNLKNKLLVPREWEEREVILEFNGPQLVLLGSDDELYLSLASDADANSIRWLRAKISKNEYDALMLGATTVRDCILKPKILVVDTDHDGVPVAEYEVSQDDLNEADLPTANSILPDEMTTPRKEALGRMTPCFLLDGPDVKRHSMGFRALGEVLQSLQRLWNAVGQTILGDSTSKGRVPDEILTQTALAFSATTPGSFGMKMDVSDPEVFRQIASRYKALVLASSDDQRLGEELHQLKTRVRSTFSDFLAVLHRHDLEILAEWDNEAAFLSSSTAQRVHSRLEFAVGEEEETLTLDGYFLGFNLKDTTFAFYDPTDESHYSGRISPRVLRSCPPITIGGTKIYQIKLSISSLHAVEGASKQVVSLEEIQILQDGEVMSSENA